MIDTSELDAWADDLRKAGNAVAGEAKKIISRGALTIKTRARELAPKGPHIPYYASSINYDVIVNKDEIYGEVGPAKGRKQWGLGNLLEYGGPYNAPHPHHEPALDEEEPRFLQYAEALAAQLVERG